MGPLLRPSARHEPQDDAEAYAEEIIAEHGELDPKHVDARLLGGYFTTIEPPA